MVFSNDVRKTKDVLGASSTQDRLMEDILAEGIALSLASATPSNYFSTKYGSNHKIIFESVAKIISRIILDLVDLMEDSSFENLRVEYISNKVLYLIFNEDQIPKYSNASELRNYLVKTINALLKGSTKESILKLLEDTSDASELSLEEVSDYVVNIFSSVYGSTSVSQNHRHFTSAKTKGLGSTEEPIGYTWGDDLHVHEIKDGVVQPHTDGHTHDLSFSLSQEVLDLQENIKKFFDVSRPAHVKIGENSTLLKEEINSPSFSLDLSLGMSFQEEMRRARSGVWEDTILAYADGSSRVIRAYKNNFKRPNEIFSKRSALSTESQKHRIISDPVLVIPSDGAYGSTFPRLKDEYEDVYTLNVNVVDGVVDLQNSPILGELIGEGELVLLDGECFFIEIVRKEQGVYDFRLKAYEIGLDNRVEGGAGIIEISNTSFTYRVEDLSYREFTYIADATSVSYIDFPICQEIYKNAPIIGDDFDILVNGVLIEDSIPANHTLTKNYNRYSRTLNFRGMIFRYTSPLGFDVNCANIGDEITIRYPYSVDYNLSFHALNDEMFTLNSFRSRRQVDTLAGRNDTIGNSESSPRHSYVLFPAQKEITKTISRREVQVSLYNQSVLNTGSLLGSMTLNTHQVDTSVSKENIFENAVGSASVRNNQLDISELGFYPSQILYIKDSSSNFYTGEIKSSYIEIKETVSDGLILEVTALSTKPFRDGSWFSGDERNDLQVPFVSTPSSPYPTAPTVDEIMANPQGRPIGVEGDKPRRISGGVEEVESEGNRGELYFYRDFLQELSLRGSPFNENNPTLANREVGEVNQGYKEVYSTNSFTYRHPYTPYSSQFILGGTVGGVTYEGNKLDSHSILAQDDSKLKQQVSIILI